MGQMKSAHMMNFLDHPFVRAVLLLLPWNKQTEASSMLIRNATLPSSTWLQQYVHHYQAAKASLALH